jgi:hypothetical protein
MKHFSKLKATVLSAALLAGTNVAMAQSAFGNVNSNGLSAGKVSQNVSNSLSGGASMFEAFLYCFGIFCIVMFVLTLVKWKKTDGREGNMGTIGVYLLAGVLSMAAPTLMGGGMSTLFGSGTVQTVKAPTASVIGN